MNLDKFVKEHSALTFIVASIAGGTFWLVTTFATVSYVDNGLAETKESNLTLLMDIKQRLERIEDILLQRKRR